MISLIEDPPAGKSPGLVEQVAEIFSPTGVLSKSRNFEYRPQQQQMAVAVARALEENQHLIVEAGTGVGKSLAYLIPAILYAVARNKKAVISTHTINLQEQLIQKDLPMLKQVFTQPEIWTVNADKLDRLAHDGLIDDEARNHFAIAGAAGSHLEILQRWDGFKGFNKTGISAIIHETDARRLSNIPSGHSGQGGSDAH